MDLLDLVKDNVEPQYVDGHVDVEDVKVSKRTKVFLEQVHKGVLETKSLLEYQPGRKYVKDHLSKGKAKKETQYQREKRDANLVPESRGQIVKFLRDQNRQLEHFIQETTESAAPTTETVDIEVDLRVPGRMLIDSEEEGFDSEVELMENEDWEF